ncbi:MAG: Asp-tRNA(Asn)/Glu-tRNA(Gln) amidotransferase subunit GatB [Chloroflexi bacterium]|nr:Asp-tRNA(Asn)/Glu-tRNA(Gln) amidotransferase subunit GatB [Chloroflexota bacterium]MCL5273670.1 Asp-tRNA(Asn)/Glu-tRNA(Gln) amidotransferase subunit GatB [Chloroflexota bacterium]
MEYEVVIGMETHVEQNTSSKMFCQCSADFFGAEPNTHVCPTCLAMPGALPVINQHAVENAIMIGLALNCKIAAHTFWERKSYWYPDLPKGYQITQYQYPIAYDGYIDVDVRDTHSGSGNWTEQCYRKRIRIRRAHLEEDTGKLTHIGDSSFVDFNRAGVPLIEIVTEPDIHTADEAYAYLSALRDIVRYLGIGSGDMEKGAMRGEPNMSLRPAGAEQFGVKVEIKNLNSLRAVRDSIDYEVKRQTELLNNGGKVHQVTMGWDDARGVTIVQREKEEAHDYRYFPEPDLPPLDVSAVWLNGIRARMPELALAKQDRFTQAYGLSNYDAMVLTKDRAIAEYFERAVAVLAAASPGEGNAKAAAKSAANWITGELFRLMSGAAVDIGVVKITPEQLAELILLVDNKTININTAKGVFEEMFAGGQSAKAIVDAKGLAQISDTGALEQAVQDALDANPSQLKGYLGGQEKLFQFFVGQVMKATKGKGNPQMVQNLLKEALEKRRAA